MPKTVRQSEILKLVRQHGSCSVGELAERLQVSGETIRRNVKPLVADGLVQKVHGGIILPEQYHEPPIQKRMTQQEEAKIEIAALVARTLPDGESLVIDTGSTTSYIAQALGDHKNLTVVTNSSYIANRLASRNGNRVFMAGGELRAHDAAAFGPSAVDFVQRFEVRYAILSMAAVHETKGCMDYHLCEAEFSQAIIRQAETVVIAADSTKFGRTGLVKVCDLEDIDRLVTDSAPPSKLAKRLDECGVEVLTTGGVRADDVAAE